MENEKREARNEALLAGGFAVIVLIGPVLFGAAETKPEPAPPIEVAAPETSRLQKSIDAMLAQVPDPERPPKLKLVPMAPGMGLSFNGVEFTPIELLFPDDVGKQVTLPGRAGARAVDVVGGKGLFVIIRDDPFTVRCFAEPAVIAALPNYAEVVVTGTYHDDSPVGSLWPCNVVMLNNQLVGGLE